MRDDALALREGRHERNMHRADENMRCCSSLPPSSRAGQRVGESRLSAHGHGAKERGLFGARATRVSPPLPTPPWYAVASASQTSVYAHRRLVCTMQAAQITTGTAELREITKMERIGTPQPLSSTSNIILIFTTSQVRIRTSAVLGSTTG